MTLLSLLLQHGEAVQEGAQPPTPFDINAGVIFWTVVIFAFLMLLLWRFAWPTILK